MLLKNIQISNFMKIRQFWVEQRDRYDGDFDNFSKASKKGKDHKKGEHLYNEVQWYLG